MNRPLSLGTRGSPLALAQARCAAAALEDAHGWDSGSVAIVVITTTGDRVQDRPLADIGGKALWTKELDRALAEGAVDLCVHSMKDVESDRPESFRLAAMLERGDVRDRLIGARSIAELPLGARIGTSSPRRTAQLKGLRPDLAIEMLRGNVETRLAKVTDGTVDATLLAAAGLDRLGIDAGTAIDLDTLLTAPGQAAIGVECRAADARVIALLEAVNHPATFDCVTAERAFTRALGGSCASPIAALATLESDGLRLTAEIYSVDGRDSVREEIRIARGDMDVPAGLAQAMLAGAPQSITTLFEVS